MIKNKAWLAAFVVLVVVVASAVSYTSMYSVHLFNSLIDNTPIGATTPSTAVFTTAFASVGFAGNLSGNASSASIAPWSGLTGIPYPFSSGQTWNGGFHAGQPSYYWGTNDSENMGIYATANLGVNYATTSGGVTNLKIVNFSGLCTAPAAYACSTTYTIPGGGYADTNYVAVCNIISPFGYPSIQGWSPVSGSQFNLSIQTGTADQGVSSGGSGVSCVLYHP